MAVFTTVVKIDLEPGTTGLHRRLARTVRTSRPFNIVSGHLRASRDSRVFQEHDITRSGAHRRARLGMACSFQLTDLFAQSSALHHVHMAPMGVAPSRSYRFWINSTREMQKLDVAMEVLRKLQQIRHAATTVASPAHDSSYTMPTCRTFSTPNGNCS